VAARNHQLQHQGAPHPDGIGGEVLGTLLPFPPIKDKGKEQLRVGRRSSEGREEHVLRVINHAWEQKRWSAPQLGEQ
jgi:hypothetical protein